MHVPSQDEFDGIKTTLVYPDSPLATDLDDKLWLPDIATCDAHRTTCTHAIYSPAPKGWSHCVASPNEEALEQALGLIWACNAM